MAHCAGFIRFSLFPFAAYEISVSHSELGAITNRRIKETLCKMSVAGSLSDFSYLKVKHNLRTIAQTELYGAFLILVYVNDNG